MSGKYKQTSLGSLLQPNGPLTMGDRHPSMIVNVKSELDINTGQAKNVKVTIAKVEKEVFEPTFLLDFSSCGNSSSLNIHVGLRAPPNAAMPYNGDTDQRITTDDYCQEILRILKARPGMKHLEIMIELRRDQDFRVFKPCPMSNPLPVNYPLFLRHVQVEVPGISPSNLPQWKFFLEQQIHLQTLICNFGVILWQFYEKTILKNSRSLQKVILRRIRSYDPNNPTQCNSFNWEIFANCAKLKFIKLTCVKDDVNRMHALAQLAYSTNNRGTGGNLQERPDDKFTNYNFTALNLQSLEEFHAAHIKIDINSLQWLKANGINLKVICVDCSDKEFYDADKGDSDFLGDDWRNNALAIDNYRFDILNNTQNKMSTGLCCAIFFAVVLLFIALILGIIFIYNQSTNADKHMTSHSPRNKSTENKIGHIHR